MKRFLTYSLPRIFIVLAVVSAGFSSCLTAREMPVERLRPLEAGKLIRQVEEKAFDYDDLTIRRISVLFSGSETDASFRASLQATKNEKIWLQSAKWQFLSDGFC